jgi:predicted transcriptional regulator
MRATRTVANGRADLRQRRQALGLSYERLGARALLSSRTIERAERGLYDSLPSTIALIEQALQEAERERDTAA